MTMRLPLFLALLLATVAVPPAGSAAEGDAPKPAKKPLAKEAEASGRKSDGKEKPRPACMVCGATCGLTPVCVCETSTKKKPVVEFEVDCDRICVPRCGGLPWPFSTRKPTTCVGCTTGCETCRGWIRTRRTLHTTQRHEEVPVVRRTVEYVCDACGQGPGCCGGHAAPRSAWPAWLPRWSPPPFW